MPMLMHFYKHPSGVYVKVDDVILYLYSLRDDIKEHPSSAEMMINKVIEQFADVR